METKTFNFGKNETLVAVNNVIAFCNNHCCRIDLHLANMLAMQVVMGNNDLYMTKRSFALVGAEDNCLTEFDYKLSCRTDYENGQMRLTIDIND